MNDEAAV